MFLYREIGVIFFCVRKHDSPGMPERASLRKEMTVSPQASPSLAEFQILGM